MTALVVSWIPFHGRSEGLARALRAQTLWTPWAKSGQPRSRTILGWVRSGVVTVARVARLPRGSVVVVMVPPVFALVAVLLVALPKRLRVVADIHSAALNAQGWAWSHPLLFRALKRCELVLVTNAELVEGLDLGDVPVLVLHDPTDELDPSAVGELPPLPEGRIAVFPASGADDEPVEQLAAAAALLEGEVTVVITGRRPGVAPGPGLLLPGFLPDAQFNALMVRADVVLALTTREATMQRAGYEALALRKPLVCSGTAVLRSFFGDAAVYTDHEPADLAAAVRRAVEQGPALVAAGETVRAQQAEQLVVAVRAIRPDLVDAASDATV
ncbi:hypothetical protein CLV35_3768 [Motilibacter peucedani]|uniref:Glycosyltransferase involved in cell wall biosynthesis n=1 Tax=Motilibacter peucedani TaxID=598650 RepID=A0A420XKT7_9ACTN|nr:hypothetical protein [Motilibacter peucedani]RKS68636.1 hypothetical protein CLV35_3768 [Motilibacter peucedani]